MTTHEYAETMTLGQDESAETRPRAFPWRWEYALLIGVALLLTAFTVAFFYFGADITNLRSYGYAGLFFINLLGSASIFLPSPAAASVVGGGAFLADFLGVPAFIWVALVAGIGESIGEFSGYAAGYGGRIMVESRPEYRRIRGWMERRGTITMFLMSVVPNPLFDLAGLAAGAVQMPMGRFFLAVLVGKIMKNLYMAGIGDLGAVLFTRFAS